MHGDTTHGHGKRRRVEVCQSKQTFQCLTLDAERLQLQVFTTRVTNLTMKLLVITIKVQTEKHQANNLVEIVKPK